MSFDAVKAYNHAFSTHAATARERFEEACRLLEERLLALHEENAVLKRENARLKNISKEVAADMDLVISDMKNLLKE